MQDSSNKLSRIEISFFDGLNSVMASNVAKKEEFMHSENVRSILVGTADKREGQSILGNLVATNNYCIFNYFNEIGNNQNLFRVSLVGGLVRIYYLDLTNQWVPIASPLATLPNTPETFCDTTMANGDLYVVDINNKNRYISDNLGALDVYDSTTPGETSAFSNIYATPNANLVNYYKDRLYLADYKSDDGVRHKNGILVSSPQLGIMSVVSANVAAGATTVPVTYTRYFIPGEIVEVYRGDVLITVFTVDSVAADSITRNHNIPNYGTIVELLSGDDIWVYATFNGKRVIRWNRGGIKEGINTGEYNSLKITGSQGNDNEQITMMQNAGNVMMVTSNNNIATWNDYVLQTLDLGIGCVSNRSYVKCSGALYFLHYTAVFMTAGDMPKVISTKVERYLSGATKAGFENSCAGKKGRNVFFAIGDVTLYKPDGSFEKVLPDTVLEYSITQDNWYVHTNIKADMMASWINDTDFDSLMTLNRGTDKPVVEFLKDEYFVDIDEEIQYRFDTKNIMIANQFDNIAYAQEVSVEMERGEGLKVFASLDMGDWYELPGECGKGSTILKMTRKNADAAMPVRCRNIRFSLRHSFKQMCKVSKLSVTYLTTNEQELKKVDYAT